MTSNYQYKNVLISLPKLSSLMLLLFLMSCGLQASEELSESFIASELQRTETDSDSVVIMPIAAPVDFVFGFLTRQLNQYVTNAVSVNFDQASGVSSDILGVGSHRIIIMDNGDKLVQRFLQYHRPFGFAYLTDMEKSTVEAPLDYSIAKYELTDVGDSRTLLKVAIVYKSSTRLLAFFVRRAFNSALQRNFERAAEVIKVAYQEGTAN